MPVITPVAALTFTLVVSLLLHVPPGVAQLSCLLLVMHTLLPPVIGAIVGAGFKVNNTAALLLHAKPLVTV